ncbi:MAG: putative Rossmann fold nucleotide-binding protein [Rhodobacteraceae bacterium HLUCCA12]|nr:MAG: putative Rossmann fold nucleotide-binding protein [Rhodobacteraceae bacterium HLUCCA12]
MPAFKASVCLFCGARAGHDAGLAETARATGAMLARENWRLVYGAGDIGLMGAVAQAMRAAGGQAMGVIPQHLMQREVARRDLSALVVTETMHERKKVMFTNSDAIIVLPGGAGTLDEFFEVLTWAQIGLHRKPIVLLDADGYWQPLLALIDHVIARGFADASLRGLFSVASDLDDLATILHAKLAQTA